MHSKNKGFSLIELMVVLAIVSILAGISTMSLVQQMPDRNLKRSARDMVSTLRKARAMAIKFNTPVTVQFDLSHNKFTLQYPGGDRLEYVLHEKGIRYGFPGRSDGANFTYYGSTSGTSTVNSFDLTFNTTGLINTGMVGYIYLQNSKGRGYRIGISSLAANIKIDQCGGSVNCTTNP